MATLQLTCQTNPGYTGQNRCAFTPGVWKWYLLKPVGIIPTAAQLATFQSYLQSQLINDNPLLRWHRVGMLVGVEDNSEDLTTFTYPDGSTAVTRDEIYRVNLEHRNGKCYQDNLIGFNGTEGQYEILPIDNKFAMMGLAAVDANSLPSITGVVMSRFYAMPYTMATNEAPARFMHTVEISDVSQLNVNGTQAQLGFNPALLKDVQFLKLNDLGGANWTTGALNIAANTACGGLNFVAEFGTQMAATAAWVATNSVTGAVITITSVTALANGSGFAFDLDQTDTDYPTSGQGVIIRTVSVSALATLGVSYYESNLLTIIRP